MLPDISGKDFGTSLTREQNSAFLVCVIVVAFDIYIYIYILESSRALKRALDSFQCRGSKPEAWGPREPV